MASVINYLTDVNWRKDYVTRRFLQRDYPLAVPEAMTPNQLAETTTYIGGNRNPYAEELCRRAGTIHEYKNADTEHDLKRIVGYI